MRKGDRELETLTRYHRTITSILKCVMCSNSGAGQGCKEHKDMERAR